MQGTFLDTLRLPHKKRLPADAPAPRNHTYVKGTNMRKKLPSAAWILIAMMLGILVGYMIFMSFPDKKAAAQIAGYVRSSRTCSCASSRC